jgi:plasmid stabilization system protein ParE
LTEPVKYLVILESDAETEILLVRQTHVRQTHEGSDALHRFDRALRTSFGLLETFPDAFPSVDEYLGLTVRRVLLRGTTKALLYVVLEESLEVRVLSCYDTRSDHPNFRP